MYALESALWNYRAIKANYHVGNLTLRVIIALLEALIAQLEYGMLARDSALKHLEAIMMKS